MLLKKNPVALKATKDAIRRVARDDLRQRRGLSDPCAGGRELLRQSRAARKACNSSSTTRATSRASALTTSRSRVAEVTSAGTMRRAIERLLRPRSVAVVGASPTPGALGASVIANLDRWGSGDIHLINPKRERDRRPTLPASRSMSCRMGVDVAVLAIPRAAVLRSVRRSADARWRGDHFLLRLRRSRRAGLRSSGRSPALPPSDGMVIEGPELSRAGQLRRWRGTHLRRDSGAAARRAAVHRIVSQSGAMACVLAVMLHKPALPVSYSISTGNEAASGVEDYVEYLLADSSTRAIGMIVEQFRQPQRFLELARRARAAGKVIVLLHPGRSAPRVNRRPRIPARSPATTRSCGSRSRARACCWRRVSKSLATCSNWCSLSTRPGGGTVVLTESGAFKALTLDLRTDWVGVARDR